MVADRPALPAPVAAAALVVATVFGVVTALAVPHRVLPVLVASVSAACLVVVGRGALAAARDGDRSWAVATVGVAVWYCSVLGATLGWPDVLVWGVLRVAGAVLVLAGGFVLQAARRSGREWRLLLLDGSLIGVSAFLVGWVLLQLRVQQVPPIVPMAIHPALPWLPLELVVVSLTAGLGIRAARPMRPQAVLVVLAAVGTTISDAGWALTGDIAVGVAGWLAVLLCIAFAASAERVDLWRPAPTREPALRFGRVSQVVTLPALVVAIVSRPDTVAAAAAVLVLLLLAVQLVVIHAQNVALWQELARQAGRLDDLLADSRDALIQVDARGVVEFASDAVEDVFGVRPGQMVGRSITDWSDGREELVRTARPVLARLVDGTDRRALVRTRLRHADGGLRHAESVVSLRDGGATPGFTISCRDTTEAEALAAEVRRQASTDPLTGLLSRAAFLALVEERLAAGPAVLLFVDLDRFKGVNDTLGHAVGDRVLQRVAHALAGAVGPDDAVARLGGDEFAVLAVGRTADDGVRLAGTLLARLAEVRRDHEPRWSGGTASIGVAVGTGPGAESLVGDADLAMYEAKTAGGGRCVAFEPRIRAQVQRRAGLVADLDLAVASGQGLDLAAQPIVDLRTGRATGFEALVRWAAPEGPLLPADFVPLAEETGQVVALGEWVLRHALERLAAHGDPRAGVSVNVAGRQLADDGFADVVRHALRDTGVAADRLTLEITEQVAVEDLTRTGAHLHELRTAGVHVALDDFGTGFSSLGYLARLPVDELKIDRRFVAGLGVRAEDDALVRAVLRLAADLGLRVVAEGVETDGQVEALRALGCPAAQGRYLAAPGPFPVAAVGPFTLARSGAGASADPAGPCPVG